MCIDIVEVVGVGMCAMWASARPFVIKKLSRRYFMTQFFTWFGKFDTPFCRLFAHPILPFNFANVQIHRWKKINKDSQYNSESELIVRAMVVDLSTIDFLESYK